MIATSGVITAPSLPDLARGVLALAYRDAVAPIVPYPDPMQSVLDTVVLSCLLRRENPPTGVPQLLQWLRKHPVGALPFGTDAVGLLPSDVLVDQESGMPTRTCIEVASIGFVNSWEQQARTMLRELADSETGFATRGDFLADNPVVTVRQTLSFSSDARTAVTWRHVSHLYERPGHILLQQGKLHVCPGCRLPAHTRESRVTWCESGECAGLGKPADVHDARDVLVLGEPLRAFHVMPGRIARALRSVSEGVGSATVVPGISGMFTLSLPTGRRLVQVLDRAQPALVAEELTQVFETEQSTLVVVPEHTMHRHPQYRAVLESAVPGGSDAVMTDREFANFLNGVIETVEGGRDA
jgi:hypothetical protein